MRTTHLLAVAALALIVTAPLPCAGQATPPQAVDGGVRFTYDAPSASSVNLAGEFNGWDPAAIPMSDEDGDGVWEVVTELQPGRTYEYKFVIDGGVSWREDPLNPITVDDNHGGVNTVLSLSEDGQVVLGYLEPPEEETVEPVVDGLESFGKKLYLAVVWHQHQPKYLKDLETGEYAEPWVRMHAIKDYYDMVSILDDYPGIHFTVNLTPVLLTQLNDVIEGYATGGGTDAYLRMTLKNAADLDMEDKVYLLSHFFSAHWDNKINIWPRYRELKAKKGGDSRAELEATAATFSEQDWRDLQAWFNLAWFDPDFQEGDVELPDGNVVTVRPMIEKGSGFTEADKRRIIETQIAIMRNVVAIHREAQERGQIEVITTPFYHPILPLIHDTDLARVAMPGTPLPERRFHRPDDARRQVQLAADYYEGMLGARPEGMWPAEGAVAQEIVGDVAAGGFAWMASDDQVLERSLGVSSMNLKQKYQMYWVQDGESRVAMIFRDHRLSDDIGFNFAKMNGVAAANSMLKSLHSIHRQLSGEDRSYVVPIILDGENAWEWFKHDGKEFFHSWYAQMERADWLETVTVADFLAEHPPTETLQSLWVGSWIGRDFSTWIGEAEENEAWDLLSMVRDDLESLSSREGVDAEAIERAFDEMYAAEGSDWFWWYGDDQNSANDGAFDEIYRGTLSNVYALLGETPPEFLSEQIVGGETGSGGGGVMARAESADEAELLKGPVVVPAGILFTHESRSATSVAVAGEFNEWSPTATPMSDDDGDGVWTVVMDLEPGRYEYKFVIDEGAVWEPDTGNPDRVDDNHGGENSVLVLE